MHLGVRGRERLVICHKIQVRIDDRIFLTAFCSTSSLSRPEYENPFEQINVRPGIQGRAMSAFPDSSDEDARQVSGLRFLVFSRDGMTMNMRVPERTGEPDDGPVGRALGST